MRAVREALVEKGPVVRRAVLLALAFGVPVLFLRLANDPFNVPKLALLIAGLAIVAALRAAELLQGAPSDGLKRLLMPAALLAVPLFISWLASPQKGWSIFGLYGRFAGLVPYLLVILAGIFVADAFAGRAVQLASALAFAAAVTGGYAVIQWLGADPFEWAIGGGDTGFVAVSTLGNSNFTGGFLAITLPLTLGLVLMPKTRRRGLKLAPLIVAGWIVSFTQGGLLAGLAGLGVTGAFVLSSRWRYARIGAVVAGFGAVAVAAAGAVYAVVNTAQTLFPITVAYRGWWWQAAWRMAVDSPLVGGGPNVFALRGVHYRVVPDAIELGYNFADDPHSVFFAMLANAGFLGGLGFLGVAAWTIWKARQIPPGATLPAAFLGAVAAYFVQSFVSIDELTLRLSLWLTLGGLVASMLQPESVTVPAKKRAKRNRKVRAQPLRAAPGVAAIGLVALAAIWWAANLVVADARILEAKSLFGQNLPEQGREQFELALGFRDDSRQRQEYGFQLGQVALARGAEGQEWMSASHEQFGSLADLPEVTWRATYGRILDGWGQFDPAAYERAIEIYREAIAIDPLNPLLRGELAQTLLDVGRAEEARATVEPATIVGARYPEVWGAVALARAEVGDNEAAQAAIDQALALDPAQPLALAAQELLEQDTTAG